MEFAASSWERYYLASLEALLTSAVPYVSYGVLRASASGLIFLTVRGQTLCYPVELWKPAVMACNILVDM